MSEFYPDDTLKTDILDCSNNENTIITHRNDVLSVMNETTELSEYNESFETLLNNSFFTDLAELMEDEKVLKFFDKNLNDKQDLTTTMLYMKLYREIQIKYKNKKHEEIDKMATLYIINVIMNTPKLRRSVILSVSDHYNDNSKIKKAISDTNLLTN